MDHALNDQGLTHGRGGHLLQIQVHRTQNRHPVEPKDLAGCVKSKQGPKASPTEKSGAKPLPTTKLLFDLKIHRGPTILVLT